MTHLVDLSHTVPFTDIDNNHLFYAHGKIWVKTTNTAGKCFDAPDGVGYGVCNFMLEGEHENEPEWVYTIDTNAVAELLLNTITNQKEENDETLGTSMSWSTIINYFKF